MVTDVHSDTNQHPSLASCFVLHPGTGCCPEPVKQEKRFLYLAALYTSTCDNSPLHLHNSLAPAKQRRDPLHLAAAQDVPGL